MRKFPITFVLEGRTGLFISCALGPVKVSELEFKVSRVLQKQALKLKPFCSLTS